MKLIDLLVQELPKRGGWPDGPFQHLNDFLKRNKLTFFVNHHYSYFEDWDGNQVTREQYEAALAAAQQPVWNGEGLPPVGCECERSWAGDKWLQCKVLFVSNEHVVVKLATREAAYQLSEVKFHPHPLRIRQAAR